jgi:outer membrane autotransporter protein
MKQIISDDTGNSGPLNGVLDQQVRNSNQAGDEIKIVRYKLCCDHFSAYRYVDLLGAVIQPLCASTLLYFCLAQIVLGASPIENQLQDVADTPAQKEIAKVIENICPGGGIVDSDLQQQCNAVAGNALDPTGDQNAARNAMQWMAPDENSVVSGTQIDTSVTQFSNVGARLLALHQAARGATAQSFTLNVNDRFAMNSSNLDNQLFGTKGGAAGDDYTLGRWGAFLSGNFLTGDRDASTLDVGFDFDVYSVTAGVDYRLQNNLILGAAAGYETTDANIDDAGGKLETDTYSISLYGTYYPSDALYVDAIAGIGRSDIEQQRNIRYSISSDGVITNINQTATGDPDGDQVFATLSVGYDLTQGPWLIGPNVRVEYRYVDVDGFTEKMSDPGAQGSGLGMRIDDQDFKSLTSTVGMQASYAWSTPWAVLVPQGRVEWVHEYENDPEIITAQFLGGPSEPTLGDNTFSLGTGEPDRDSFDIGLGVSANFPNGLSGYLYYQTVLGYSNLESHGVGVGLRMSF